MAHHYSTTGGAASGCMAQIRGAYDAREGLRVSMLDGAYCIDAPDNIPAGACDSTSTMAPDAGFNMRPVAAQSYTTRGAE